MSSQFGAPFMEIFSSVVLSLVLVLLLFPWKTRCLNSDGSLLLAFKYAVLNDPLSVLADWNYDDPSPCAWNGVMCGGFPASNSSNNNNSSSSSTLNISLTTSRVISLVLPNSQLLGSIPPELSFIEHLRHLDLSGNILNGTLPGSLFNASKLRVLSLASNKISGEIPELVGAEMSQLQVLNISDNALTGEFPEKISLIPNLTVLSLSNNYLSGEISASGFDKLELLDLSFNLINGSLPSDFSGGKIKYLNLSYNRLAGAIPPEFGKGIPENATVDISYNNLTGAIPDSHLWVSQKPKSFAGNPDLCGSPLKNLCPIPSTLSNPPPNVTTTDPTTVGGVDSPPAFAAIPRNPTESSSPGYSAGLNNRGTGGGLKPAVIAAIIVGDLAGVGLLFIVFMYAYQAKKKKHLQQEQPQNMVKRSNGLPPLTSSKVNAKDDSLAATAATVAPTLVSSRGHWLFGWCYRKKSSGGSSSEDTEETTSSSSSSDPEAEDDREKNAGVGAPGASGKVHLGATLVMVDNEIELELETLLKASAYMLGATGNSIVYKAVLGDGKALAVRRIGESSGAAEKLKEFEAHVRSIAKFKHPNLLRIRGFYWGADEKLLICDYAPNGSLSNITFSKKLGSSPYQLPLDSRLRIARGVARCLVYLHDKKLVHANIKPSNILLGADFEPMVGDFGLDRLLSGTDLLGKPGISSRHFGSKRSTHSQSSLPDFTIVSSLSPSPTGSLSSAALPYQAPESLKNIKPNTKWDVYSFGIVLLELITGRVVSEAELVQWNSGYVIEESNRVLRMADPAIRGEADGKEEALLALFKLGFGCASLTPQKRPTMKEASQVIERITLSSSSTSTTSSMVIASTSK